MTWNPLYKLFLYISSNTQQLTGGLRLKLPNRSIIHSPKTDLQKQMQNWSSSGEKNASICLHQTNKYKIKILLCAHHWSPFFTCFFGELCEGLHSLFSITALRGDGGDIRPAKGSNNVHHGLGLEGVWRNHPWEEVVAPVVTQLWGCGRVADLRDLEEKKGRECLTQLLVTILVQHRRRLPK